MGRKRKTNEEFIKEIYSLVGNEYKVLSDYVSSSKPMKFKHMKCGNTFFMRPNHFISQGSRCKYCSSVKSGKKRRKTHKEFLMEVKELVGIEYSIQDAYKNDKTKLKIEHNSCGKSFHMTPNSFLSGTRCPYCFGSLKKTTNQFIKEVKELVADEYEVLGRYNGNKKGIKFKHSKCGNVFSMTPNSFLIGQRCPECSRYNQGGRHTQIDFKNKVYKLVGDEYEVVGNYFSNNTLVEMHHEKCGYVWEVRPSNFLRGSRCPRCMESSGEREIRRILEKEGIPFKEEYRFQDCKYKNTLPFDFALLENSKVDTLIEFQGEQHYKPIEFFGGLDSFKIRKARDEVKRQYCKENNLKLIEVPYNVENIELYLHNQLNAIYRAL